MPSNENTFCSGLDISQGNRILYPDILRILAVFAVMMLHVSATGFYSNPVQSFTWQVVNFVNFYECMVRWAVPVFVMVSGMFLLNPQKEITLSKLYRKNIFRIVMALITWGLFYRSLSISKMIF